MSMAFLLDSHIAAETTLLMHWPLSLVLLKNDASYPWLILVPQVAAVEEIYQLQTVQRQLLMDEIYRASNVMQDYFQPEKLNIANLGNRVRQLHIHIVARFSHDPLWPQGVWQTAQRTQPYTQAQLDQLSSQLRVLLQ
jgi:diadenosine tetraphosphate (Ap4A) HIT family hydrolase